MVEDFAEMFGRPGASSAELFYRDLMGLRRRGRQREGWAETQPNPSPPAGLTLVDHFHVERTCSDGKRWIPAGTVTKMTPSTMDPGFLTSAGKLQFDDKLDKSLIDTLVDDTSYRTFLAATSIKARWPSAGDRIRVCLVDLSGDKICRPGYAGWGSTYDMAGASTAKIALIYAAHQIVFDLKQMATARGITSVSALQTHAHGTPWAAFTCKPKVDQLVTVGASGVAMAPALTAALDEIVDGANSTKFANNTLLNIGFEYVASLMWQSGLRQPSVNGLWYSNSYQAPTDVTLDPACHSRDKQGAVHWTKDPLKAGGIMLTARSVATFFTLLAQRRLADETTSVAIEAFLKRGCALFDIMKTALSGVRASKCGATSTLLHDAGLIEHGKVRYVMVYLTKNLQMPAALRTRLIKDLDGLIVANNP